MKLGDRIKAKDSRLGTFISFIDYGKKARVQWDDTEYNEVKFFSYIPVNKIEVIDDVDDDVEKSSLYELVLLDNLMKVMRKMHLFIFVFLVLIGMMAYVIVSNIKANKLINQSFQSAVEVAEAQAELVK